MLVTYHKTFKKNYINLKPAQKKRLKAAIELFMVEPYHPDLYNHPLTAEWSGHRSFAFGGDWRVHYKEIAEDEVVLVTLGTHSQLYK
jgi:mRNA interferase YafQ